jgi:hypothetical protein
MDLDAEARRLQGMNVTTTLKPVIVVYTGKPSVDVVRVLQGVFPSIRVMVTSEDSQLMRLEEATESYVTGRDRALRFVRAFMNVVWVLSTPSHSVGRPNVDFRYRLHRGHMQLRAFHPGQKLYVLKATTSAGNHVEASVWLFDTRFDPNSDVQYQQHNIWAECVSSASPLTRIRKFGMSFSPPTAKLTPRWHEASTNRVACLCAAVRGDTIYVLSKARTGRGSAARRIRRPRHAGTVVRRQVFDGCYFYVSLLLDVPSTRRANRNRP